MKLNAKFCGFKRIFDNTIYIHEILKCVQYLGLSRLKNIIYKAWKKLNGHIFLIVSN